MRRLSLIGFLLLAPLLQAADDTGGTPPLTPPDPSAAAIGTAMYYSSGLELLAYPTGFQPTLQIMPLRFERAELQLFVGTNMTDHRDLGLHSRELGWGLGGGLGANWWPFERQQRFFTGLRGDLWRMNMHWEDPKLGLSGDSLVTVWQPSFLIGYRLPWKGSFYSDFILSLGREYNAATEGAPVAQDTILRGGMSLGWR